MVENLAINLVNLVQGEGIALKRSGKAYMGCCPFHHDKTPSFAVYEDSKRFICYGCGEKGDAIAFIMKHRGLTFKDTLTYLGVGNAHKTPRKIARKNNRRKLVDAFRKWENDYYDELATQYRVFNSTIMKFKTMEEAEKFAPLYHQLPIWEYHMDILMFGDDDDDDKIEMYKEVGLCR